MGSCISVTPVEIPTVAREVSMCSDEECSGDCYICVEKANEFHRERYGKWAIDD